MLVSGTTYPELIPRGGQNSLTFFFAPASELVGFYAGLNLVAWFMIFCFVRETKQLTLEELDRKLALPSFQNIPGLWPNTNHLAPRVLNRGLLRPDEEIHQPRINRLPPILHKAIHPPEENPEATRHHRDGRQSRAQEHGIISLAFVMLV